MLKGAQALGYPFLFLPTASNENTDAKARALARAEHPTYRYRPCSRAGLCTENAALMKRASQRGHPFFDFGLPISDCGLRIAGQNPA